jgi:excisionase family DNA binding protein
MLEPEAFSISEASEVTRLGRSSINAAIRVGKLRARKFGRRTIILPADLRQFLATLPPAKLMHEKSGVKSMDDYTRKTTYDHPSSKKRRAERKITSQNSVEVLRGKHNDRKAEQGRRHRAEDQALMRKHENEIAHDRDHSGGRGRGDRERDKERAALHERHRRERDDLNVQLDKEMAAAKKKAAESLD